ncbi:unnamed protein product, partial [Effrenium voratum]
ALSSVYRWDLAPGKQRERGGVTRVPVMFGLAEAARMEVTGGAGGRVPVGFGPQRRGDNEARSSECGGIWFQESSEHELCMRVPVVPVARSGKPVRAPRARLFDVLNITWK